MAGGAPMIAPDLFDPNGCCVTEVAYQLGTVSRAIDKHAGNDPNIDKLLDLVDVIRDELYERIHFYYFLGQITGLERDCYLKLFGMSAANQHGDDS